MTITFLLLCIGANLLFFLLRRFEAREKSCPNYIPDDGVTTELLSLVPATIIQYGKKADGQIPCSTVLPCSIRSFFSEYESLRFDGDGVVISRKFIEVPYSGNADFLQIGTVSYGEDVVLVRRSEKDASVYIVGCEDDDPAHPELYATSFEKFLAMCIGQYIRTSKTG